MSPVTLLLQFRNYALFPFFSFFFFWIISYFFFLSLTFAFMLHPPMEKVDMNLFAESRDTDMDGVVSLTQRVPLPSCRMPRQTVLLLKPSRSMPA